MVRFIVQIAGLVIICFLGVCCSPYQSIFIRASDGVSGPLPHLDKCDDFTCQMLEFEAEREVVLLVHGCKASSSRFGTLQQVFASRQQQALCFNYDYRDFLEHSAGTLVRAIQELVTVLKPTKLTIIGHSQGGLVARRALIRERTGGPLPDVSCELQLVTISTPFNGISQSAHCGSKTLHILSGGLTVLICQGIAGAIWSEVHPRAVFINKPGTLLNSVSGHLKIVTDERNTCRHYGPAGNCVKSDYIFSLEEQYHPVIDRDARVTNVELQIGHALVVGTTGNPPFTLLDILEKKQILHPDTTTDETARHNLLASLYLTSAPDRIVGN